MNSSSDVHTYTDHTHTGYFTLSWRIFFIAAYLLFLHILRVQTYSCEAAGNCPDIGNTITHLGLNADGGCLVSGGWVAWNAMCSLTVKQFGGP